MKTTQSKTDTEAGDKKEGSICKFDNSSIRLSFIRKVSLDSIAVSLFLKLQWDEQACLGQSHFDTILSIKNIHKSTFYNFRCTAWCSLS